MEERGDVREITISYARRQAAEQLALAYALVRGLQDADGEAVPDDFVFDFFSIVEDFKTASKPKEYYARVKLLIDDLDKAVLLIENALNSLSTLLPAHHKIIWQLMCSVEKEQTQNDSIALQLEVCEGLSASAIHLQTMSLALRAATGDNGIKGPGAPTLPFVLPTIDFILCWEKWIPRHPDGGRANKYQSLSSSEIVQDERTVSGALVVTDVPTQAAARFVHIGLKLIDPEATPQNAVTSYHNALQTLHAVGGDGITTIKDRMAALLSAN